MLFYIDADFAADVDFEDEDNADCVGFGGKNIISTSSPNLDETGESFVLIWIPSISKWTRQR